MKKLKFLLSTLLLLVLAFSWGWSFPIPAWSVCDADCETIEECIRKQAECQKEIDARLEAHEKNKQDLANLEKNLANTESLIAAAEGQIEDLEDQISQDEKELAGKQEIFAARVRSFYIRSSFYSPLLILFSSADASQLTRELNYWRVVTDEDKKIILTITQEVKDLEENKKDLEEKRAWLAAAKEKTAAQVTALAGEVDKVEGYFEEVSGKIAQLSAKQQALLAARAGTFTTSVGEVPISNIPCSGPPGSPVFCDPGGGNWFGAFSFGAWTHRKGMSQYGAKGRAEAGQSANEILQAYYERTPVGKDTGGTISVSGYGDLNFEGYYLMGIAEMPSSWHTEALKAQAIAARSYAYNYKVEGRSICATQACQVFSQSKANNPPEAWRQAVEATRGLVLEGVTAFYSSTSGGYLIYPRGFWDTTDNQGGEGFASRAWESRAGSPWFYSSWYTESYTSGSAKCGRPHPWLNEEEMADILNAWIVLDQSGSDDRILPVTINQCPIGGTTGNPYSMAELRDRGGVTSVSSVSVVYSQAGETSSVSFSTNQGPINISGSSFKQAFNLRAPGYIAIRSPLFNVLKK